MAGTIWNGMLIISMDLTPFPSPEYFTDQPKRLINQAVKIVQTKEERGMTAYIFQKLQLFLFQWIIVCRMYMVNSGRGNKKDQC